MTNNTIKLDNDQLQYLKPPKAHAIGVNHIALEVGDVEEALAFYEKFFEFEVRIQEAMNRGDLPLQMAEIVMGDQFIALVQSEEIVHDRFRHFGLVVDDPNSVRELLIQNDIEIIPGRDLNFRDPWGNFIQVMDYREIEFLKAPQVLRLMKLETLSKSNEVLSDR